MDHVDEDKCRVSVNNMAVREKYKKKNITWKRKASTTQYCRTVSVIEKCSVLNVVYNRNEVKRGGNITLETDCYLNSRKK